MFHPILIVTVLLKFLLLLFVPLFQLYHLSRIDEVSRFDNSLKILHKFCQTPMNCQCKQLLASVTAPEIFVDSFPSPEKLLFCTDMLGSIEW